MEVPRFRTLETSSTNRQMVIREFSWATLGLALALTLAVGCKNQQPAAGQTGQGGQPGQQEARTDPQITGDIQAKIQGESALGGQNIQVSVSNGVATLSGTVADEASRALAGNDSGTVLGVKTVVNNLIVQPAQHASAPPPARAPKEQPRHDRVSHEQAGSAPLPAPMSQPANNAPAASSQPSAPPPAPPRPVTQQLTLDAGTVVPVTLTEALDSKTAQPNDVFHATVSSDLMSHGIVAIPRGTPVLGRVVDVKEAAHFKGNALLTIELTELTERGRKISLVTDSYSKTGAGRGKNTAEKAGGGAALGAIIGALAGGGKGAAIGAAAGAGAGTGVNAVTRGQQAQIPSESQLQFQLQSPITVTVTTTAGGRSDYDPNSEPQLQQR